MAENKDRLTASRRQSGTPSYTLSPEFDVPLTRGGITALLMCADLNTQEGADRFLSAFVLPRDGVSPPSLEQLRMAQDVARGLGFAILFGDAPSVWRPVELARDALFSTTDGRRGVVSILTDLHGYRERDDKFRAQYPDHVDPPGEGLELEAFKALEALAAIDIRFATVCVCDLVSLVRQYRPMGIAVKLSLRCGTFGDGLTLAEQALTKATQRERRVRGLYEAAQREQRALDKTAT